MRNKLGGLCVASCLALILPCSIQACVIVPEVVDVGSQFRVSVTDRGRPVKGLRLILSTASSPNSPSKTVMDTFTDANGYARFSNLNPGSLWLSADHDVGIGDAVIVDVSPSGPSGVTVPLRWPSRAPLVVRSVSGVLRTSDYYPNHTQGLLSLSLFDQREANLIVSF